MHKFSAEGEWLNQGYPLSRPRRRINRTLALAVAFLLLALIAFL